MQYRTLPKNGDKLSALGYGCMRLPMIDRQIDEARAISQIRAAIDRGVNYVDTAWPYHGGLSEVILGKALQDGYRDKVRVATKLPSWMIKSRTDMDRYLQAQMEKLQTNKIDYYLLHALNGASWDILVGLGALEFLDTAKKDGRIVNAGFSFHGLADDFIRIIDGYPWEFCQIQFNYLDQEYQAGTKGLLYAASKNIGVIVMEPLRGGNLAKPIPPPAVQSIWDESATRYSPVEWALRWVLNYPEVTMVLSGMNDEKHIEENLAIADRALANSLTSAELALVDRASRKYQELMKVGCTGCGYCMPCPEEVMIPICFEEYNTMHAFGGGEATKFRYALRMSGELADGRPGYASQCVACGTCLDKCPQQIAIPDILAQIAEEMEGPEMPKRFEAARKMFKVELK